MKLFTQNKENLAYLTFLFCIYIANIYGDAASIPAVDDGMHIPTLEVDAQSNEVIPTAPGTSNIRKRQPVSLPPPIEPQSDSPDKTIVKKRSRKKKSPGRRPRPKRKTPIAAAPIPPQPQPDPVAPTSKDQAEGRTLANKSPAGRGITPGKKPTSELYKSLKTGPKTIYKGKSIGPKLIHGKYPTLYKKVKYAIIKRKRHPKGLFPSPTGTNPVAAAPAPVAPVAAAPAPVAPAAAAPAPVVPEAAAPAPTGPVGVPVA